MPRFATFGLAAVILVSSCGGADDETTSTDAASTTSVSAGASTLPSASTTSALAPASTQATESDQAGVLAIQSSGIELVDLSTGDRTPIASEAGAEHPDWSPDGASIVFHTDFSKLWVADIATGERTELFECVAPCGAVQDPAWSPDGTEVAFMLAETDGATTTRSAIEAIDVGTGVRRTVYEDTSGTVWTVGPRWSPDGTTIVFDETTWASDSWTEDKVASVAVATVADGSSSVTRLVEWDGPLVGPGSPSPDWSSQGDLIVYSRDDNLYTIHPDGSAATAITEYDGIHEHAIQPAFTPDGASVVFTFVTGEWDVDDKPEAALVSIDGSGFTALTPQATHPRMAPQPT